MVMLHFDLRYRFVCARLPKTAQAVQASLLLLPCMCLTFPKATQVVQVSVTAFCAFYYDVFEWDCVYSVQLWMPKYHYL